MTLVIDPRASAVRRPVYMAMTAELTLGTGTGKNRILSLFHPSAVPLTYEILELYLFFKVKHTVGVGQYKLSFATVESATGTVLTSQGLSLAAAASSASVRAATAADGTLTGNPFLGQTSSLTAISGEVGDEEVLLYQAKNPEYGEQPITLRGGQAEGILLYQDVTSTLTTAPIVAAAVKWAEF